MSNEASQSYHWFRGQTQLTIPGGMVPQNFQPSAQRITPANEIVNLDAAVPQIRRQRTSNSPTSMRNMFGH